jgi:AbrB family looped-hinge helix DNA binding protein
MTTATLTSKGQTTIPKDIREQAGLHAGDRMHFTVLANGAIMLRVKRRSVADLQGMLKPRRKLRTSDLSR